MKLVKFMCTVRVIQAEEAEEDKVEAHAIWVNPDDVQMVAPEGDMTKGKEHLRIYFKGRGGSTSVEGTYEEVVAALTSA